MQCTHDSGAHETDFLLLCLIEVGFVCLPKLLMSPGSQKKQMVSCFKFLFAALVTQRITDGNSPSHSILSR